MEERIDVCCHAETKEEHKWDETDGGEREEGKSRQKKRRRDVVVRGLIPLRYAELLLRERRGDRGEKENDL